MMRLQIVLSRACMYNESHFLHLWICEPLFHFLNPQTRPSLSKEFCESFAKSFAIIVEATFLIELESCDEPIEVSTIGRLQEGSSSQSLNMGPFCKGGRILTYDP
jgi:hypothetical protein